MFDFHFPSDWSTQKKLIWLKAMGIAGDASDPLSTITGDIVRFMAKAAKPVKQLVANIEPVQDLHGYDYPWPAGGGKNKFDEDSADWKTGYYLDDNGQEQSSSIYKYTQSYIAVSSDTAYAFSYDKTTGNSCAMTVAEYDGNKTFISKTTVISSTSAKGQQSGTLTTSATTAFIRISAPYSSTADGYGTTDFQIELGSTATSYAPYENICPISGWTGCNIEQRGENLINFKTDELLSGRFASDGSITGTSSSYTKHTPKYAIKGGITGTVYFGGAYSSAALYMCFYDENDIFISGLNQRYLDHITFNVPENAASVAFSYVIGTYTGITVVAGSVAPTEQIPYAGTTLPITFPDAAGTVYGGTLTINEDGSGTLIVDRDIKSFSDYNDWIYDSRGFFNTNNKHTGIRQQSSVLSELYRSESWSTTIGDTPSMSIKLGASTSTQTKIYVTDTRFDNVEDWLSEVSNSKFVIYRSIPVEITLTAEEVGQLLTLKGENNVWADTGDIEVTVYGTPIVEPQADTLTSLNILLGGAYRNNHTPDDVSDEEALNILMGGSTT